MIKDSTRGFATLCIILTGILLALAFLPDFEEGGQAAQRVLWSAFLVGWGLMFVRPLIGWWMLVVMYLALLVWMTGIALFRGDIPHLGMLAYVLMNVIGIAVPLIPLIPLIVLALDSPWRWRRVREAQSAEG